MGMHTITKLLAGGLAAIYTVPAFAADYAPMIREDRVWEYYKEIRYNTETDESYYGLFSYRFDGIEEHYGREYHRCMLDNAGVWKIDGENVSMAENMKLDKCVGLLREEDRKVYILLEGETVRYCDAPYDRIETRQVVEGEEAVLFDFSISDGVGVNLYLTNFYGESMISESKAYDCGVSSQEFSTFRFRNHAAPAFNPSPEDLYGYGITISAEIAEGIGNIGGGDMIRYGGTKVDAIDGYGEENSEWTDWKARLINEFLPSYWGNNGGFNNCYDLDGNVLYQGRGLKEPELSVIDSIMDSEASTDCVTYDVMGRQVYSTVPGSIYIRNGYKFVAR